ncbi:hypothetical protein NDU88_004738 [Pleurodeles waltl]|uniref:Uncharacterized protein n=1 Tax=Pleurodeles waltl TaxID=8319 RepID=A0AAV7RI80_PLEWA|nr:hypothetical protein NDU88_004738 [Pleurodeles waltl]
MFPAHRGPLGPSDPYLGGTLEGLHEIHSKPDIRLQILENPEVTQEEKEEDGEERARSAPSLKHETRRSRRRTGACRHHNRRERRVLRTVAY